VKEEKEEAGEEKGSDKMNDKERYVKHLAEYLRKINKIHVQDESYKEQLLQEIKNDDYLSIDDRNNLIKIVEGITPNSGVNVEEFWKTPEYKKIYRKVKAHYLRKKLFEKGKIFMERMAQISQQRGWIRAPAPPQQVIKPIQPQLPLTHIPLLPIQHQNYIQVYYNRISNLWNVAENGKLIETFTNKQEAITYGRMLKRTLKAKLYIYDEYGRLEKEE